MLPLRRDNSNDWAEGLSPHLQPSAKYRRQSVQPKVDIFRSCGNFRYFFASAEIWGLLHFLTDCALHNDKNWLFDDRFRQAKLASASG